MTYKFKNHLTFFPIFLLLTVIVSVLVVGCGNSSNQRNISSFYFPVEKLADGMVYEYRHPADSLAPFYHYFRNVKSGDSLFLVGMRYNHLFEPEQFSTEEKISNGMLLTQSVLYQKDSLEKQISMPMEIKVGSVFPFEVRDSGGVFVYNVKWHDADDPEKFTNLIRNRSFAGDTTYVFNGKGAPAVKMAVREKVESYDNGFIEHEFNTLEIYAENIGLVYFRKEVTPDLIIEYQLVDRYPMSVLEAKFGKVLNGTR